jgi:polyisoprenoid-binding protein YceI
VNVGLGSAVRGAAFILALAGRSAAAGGTTYAVDPARSAVAIHVGRAGLFKVAGHEHEVLATRLEGEVQADPSDLAGSSVSLAVDATALKVSEQGAASRG